MRTACLLTVSCSPEGGRLPRGCLLGGVSTLGVCPRGCLPRHTPRPEADNPHPLRTESQTVVKTVPPRNYHKFLDQRCHKISIVFLSHPKSKDLKFFVPIQEKDNFKLIFCPGILTVFRRKYPLSNIFFLIIYRQHQGFFLAPRVPPDNRKTSYQHHSFCNGNLTFYRPQT